jgi:predicted signal transduction protein with EAL and GGDEF domain
VVPLAAVGQSEDEAITARGMPQTVAQAHSIDQHDLHLTTSIGAGVFPEDGQDAETLIKNADTATYQAKENGRQSYQFFKQAMNVRAVDDFGTAYSSLSYLRKFPIDALKMDLSFVRQITTAADETTIVTKVRSICRSLTLRVGAAGVKMQEELTFLQVHQRDLAQGCHFSRPVVVEQFANLLKYGIPEAILS